MCQICAFAQINDTNFVYSMKLSSTYMDVVSDVVRGTLDVQLHDNPKCYNSTPETRNDIISGLVADYTLRRMGIDMYEATKYYMEEKHLATLDLEDDSFITYLESYLPQAINVWVQIDAIVMSKGEKYLPEGKLKDNIKSVYDERTAFANTYVS